MKQDQHQMSFRDFALCALLTLIVGATWVIPSAQAQQQLLDPEWQLAAELIQVTVDPTSPSGISIVINCKHDGFVELATALAVGAAASMLFGERLGPEGVAIMRAISEQCL